MNSLAKRLEGWLCARLPLLLALILLILLRIPNFFEPYWYGDEGIYLTVGQAMRDGEKLYTEIVDHKTPIIYYLASVPNQFSFRTLNLGWMIMTTIAFYAVAKKLLESRLGLITSTFLFVILTSVPWFEGHLPNGELFVMGFVLTGAWLLTKTKLFDFFMEKRKILRSLHNPGLLFLAGVLFGLAILTKVPGLFDVVAFISLGWFVLTNRLHWLFQGKNQRRRWWHLVKRVFLNLLPLLAGLLLPILISIIYFVALGSGQDYLQFGLLYNFHYTTNWSLPFTSDFLNFFFTLPGKFIVTTTLILVITGLRKKIKPAAQLIMTWAALALMAALLSNRPYPHYFQQVIPALVLLFGLLVGNLKKVITEKTISLKSHLATFLMSLTIFALTIGALFSLNFYTYPALSYYQNFYRLITGQMSLADYRQSFDDHMTDNYQAAEIIKESGVDEIFIWGTNPMLYALSQTQPTGRFTVAFHIEDLGVYEETMASVKAKEPLFIVVMKNQQQPLEGLEEYLDEYYILNSNFENFWFWKRFK